MVAALGAVVGGFIAADAQKSAAKKSANAISDASDAASRTQKEIFDRQVSLSAPTAQAGASAQARQMLMLGYSPDEVKAFLRQSDAAWNGGGAVGSPDWQAYLRANPDVAAEAARLGVDPIAKAQQHWAEFGQAEGRAQPTIGGGDDYGWVDSFSPDEYVRSLPGYDFRLKEGQKALERSAAARGNLFSGGTGIALDRYGQDYATGEWDNQYRRLGQIAGQGADATGTTIQVAGQYGDAASANQRAAGNARATGYQQAGQAQADFWGNTVPGAIGWGYGYGQKQGWF